MFNVGDILSIQYIGFKHYGIYIGNDLVIHNSKKFGLVQEVSLKEFADNRSVSLSNIKPDNPAIAAQRAKKYLNLPYNLFSDNCEHFVRTVSGLVKESTQVQTYLITALGTGVLLKADSHVVKAAGGAATIAALLTPSETSPVKSSAVAACLAAGLAYLAIKG